MASLDCCRRCSLQMLAGMTDQPKTRSSIIAITENMVKAGLDILEDMTSADPSNEDCTDAQLS